MVTTMKTFSKITTLALLLLLIQACDQLSSYSIDYPVNNATYIGTTDAPPPISDGTTTPMQTEFKISYDSPPSTDIDVIFNGHKIGQYFVYGPSSATADINQFKQLIRHGKNTLSVDPLGLGPSVIFNADMHGPDLIITRGEVVDSGANVEIEGQVRDFSEADAVLEVDLTQLYDYQADGKPTRNFIRTVNINVNADGTFCACGADKVDINGLIVSDDPNTVGTNEQRALLYSFRANDKYGYSSEIEFLADSDTGDALPIESAVRVAVGDTFIESLRPIIASALYESMKKAPFDVRFVPAGDFGVANSTDGVGNEWDDPYKDGSGDCPESAAPNDGNACWSNDGNDGLRFGPGLNPLTVDMGMGEWPTLLNRLYLAQGGESIGGETAGTGTVLLNGLKLKDGNLMDLNLAITEMLADLTIDAGWFLGTINVGAYIERLVILGDIKVEAIDKDMTVQFQEDSASFTVQGMHFDKLEVWGIPLTGFGNFIAPAIEGAIEDMLPGLLNQIFEDNLEKLIIGGRLTQPESGSEFDMLLNIAQMGTSNILGQGNPYDLIIDLESVANLITPDNYVKSALGPIYYDDPVDPNDVYNSLGDSGTNLTVAVNSNMINQVLASLYSVGVSHFTMYNGQTLYGANPNLPADKATPNVTTATNGDTRVRLWPDMPPRLDFAPLASGQGGGTASITYDSATLYMDKMVDGNWQTDASMNVSFDLGITINENGGVVELGSAGPPTFTINSMQNNSSIQIPQAMLQGLMDAALFIGGDILADRKIRLDMNQIVEGTLSGTEVLFMSDQDDYTIDENVAGACISFDEQGNVETPLRNGVTAGSDGDYDLICEVVNFVASTNTLGVTGVQGRNLFFQMEARDPAIPPAPALPRFDLDDDDIVDYKDNCAVGAGDLAEAIQNVLDDPNNGFNGTLADNIMNKGDTYPSGHPDAGQPVREEDWGKPVPGFENAIREEANDLYAVRKGTGTGATPATEDFDHYNNMRTGDADITLANAGSYPWLTMLFNNPSQINQDNDRLGDLCENDDDRDGIWASYDNGMAADDNCPYKYNPSQEDTQNPVGVGDACNVRTTFVLLRSLESAVEGAGVPRCLTRRGLTGSNWVSDTLKNMDPCDPDDLNQRWYMKAVNPNDLLGGVQFFDAPARSTTSNNRLTTYGVAYSDGQTGANAENRTRVNEMRLLQTSNAGLNGQNGESVSTCGWGAFACYREHDRADPVFHLRSAAPSSNYNENTHPWYIDTNFYYNFANSGFTNIGAGSCMTYTSGWGVDIGSQGDSEFCSDGARWRWAIWVGGEESPWNGIW